MFNMNQNSAVIDWDESPVCLTHRTGSATPKAWHWQTSHPQQIKLWNCRKTTVCVFFQWEYRNRSCNTFLYTNYVHVTILPLSWGRIFFNKKWQGPPPPPMIWLNTTYRHPYWSLTDHANTTHSRIYNSALSFTTLMLSSSFYFKIKQRMSNNKNVNAIGHYWNMLRSIVFLRYE